VPETITIDGSAAHAAAIKSDNEEHGTVIALRPVQYLHNIVEQDQHSVKRVIRLMLGSNHATPPRGCSPGLHSCP
jgi:transposase-like protein